MVRESLSETRGPASGGRAPSPPARRRGASGGRAGGTARGPIRRPGARPSTPRSADRLEAAWSDAPGRSRSRTSSAAAPFAPSSSRSTTTPSSRDPRRRPSSRSASRRLRRWMRPNRSCSTSARGPATSPVRSRPSTPPPASWRAMSIRRPSTSRAATSIGGPGGQGRAARERPLRRPAARAAFRPHRLQPALRDHTRRCGACGSRSAATSRTWRCVPARAGSSSTGGSCRRRPTGSRRAAHSPSRSAGRRWSRCSASSSPTAAYEAIDVREDLGGLPRVARRPRVRAASATPSHSAAALRGAVAQPLAASAPPPLRPP